MNKDFQLILKAATEAHIAVPATEAAFHVNSEELAHHDEDDFSAVLRRMEENAGVALIAWSRNKPEGQRPHLDGSVQGRPPLAPLPAE